MAKKKPYHPFLLFLLSRATSFWFWLVRVTTRWTHHGRENRDRLIQSGKPFIVGFWHGRLMMAAFLKQGYPGRFVMLSSTHRDAEILISAIKPLGVEFVRGSSTNPDKRHKAKFATSGTRALLRALNEGAIIGMTPDGPRGPRQRLQPGIVQIAKITGLPILPIGASTSRVKRFSSWDRFMLAMPFAKAHIIYGDPVTITGETEEELQQARQRMENLLTELQDKADALAGHPPTETAPMKERHRRRNHAILDQDLMEETSS